MPEIAVPADRRDLASQVNDLIRESSTSRFTFIEQCTLNDTMYLGHISETERPRDGLSYILINKTGQAIISHAQIQTETRPRVEIIPRQKRTKPQWWMTRKALNTIRSLMDQGVITWLDDDSAMGDAIAAEMIGEQVPVEEQGFDFTALDNTRDKSFVIPDSFYIRVLPLFEPWPTTDAMGNPVIGPDGQPAMNMPVLREGDIFKVDDEMTAKAVQNNINITWDVDERDLWLRNNIVNTLKFGCQGVMFLFDKDTKQNRVFDIHYKNLYLPPNCTGTKDAEYVIVRELLSVREALERFPYASEQIEAFKNRRPNSTPNLSSDVGQNPPYAGVEFGRDMIEIFHIWWRGWRYPMSPDDALSMGKIVQRKVSMLDEATGAVKQASQFFLTDEDYNVTAEVTSPEDENWPSRNGIKYMQMISQEIVYDEECAHCDIPVVVNQNIPVSFSPWAQGEPERLWFVQKMIDKMSSIILDHITYFRSPQQILPLSVYKRMKGLSTVYSHPDRDAILDDGTFMQFADFFRSGKGFYIDPPPMPQGYFDLWQFAIRLHDELSGHVGVLQGRAPGANSSGKLVQELQAAARGSIGFKAAQTESMLRQLTRLDVDAQAKWMPLIFWARANDEYPPEVLAAIRQRSRRLDFDIKIEITSGGGETRKQKLSQAAAEVQAQVRSPESYRREAEIDDADPEWREQRAAMMQAAQTPQPANSIAGDLQGAA